MVGEAFILTIMLPGAPRPPGLNVCAVRHSPHEGTRHNVSIGQNDLSTISCVNARVAGRHRQLLPLQMTSCGGVCVW